MKNNITKKDIVRNYIMGQINSNIYKPHEMIESENQLSSKIGVSRVTVRNAIEELVNERILIKHHGKGTYLNSFPSFSDFMNGIGFSHEVKRRNMIPSAKLLNLEITEPTLQLRKELKLSENEKVVRVERVRFADNIPVAYESASFPYSILGDINEGEASNSIYDYLEKKGYIFDYADQRVNATVADSSLSKLLDVPVGHPLIEMYVLAYTKEGLPFNAGTTYYQTNTFKLVQTVYKK